jgi:hypothetical protein
MKFTLRTPFSRIEKTLPLLLLVASFSVRSEPIIMTGAMVPKLIGAPISHLRLVDVSRRPIPFQIDEITAEGEYVCPQGPEPNSNEGNGVLDSADEIVFLREDITTVAPENAETRPPHFASRRSAKIDIADSISGKSVYLCNDPTLPQWSTRYIDYNDTDESVMTPYYSAQFGRKRFHFVKAGIKMPGAKDYYQLTNELRISIHLKTFFGMLPIEYNENNIICTVKRYKTGPIRLIRRGDFHLNLGLLIKGSRAAVNQICYPQLVWVPVFVHLPIRFKKFFTEAYIEMTPVIREEGRTYSFSVPGKQIAFDCGGSEKIDTLVQINPNNGFMSLSNGSQGYGWLLQAGMPDSLLSGSGYRFSRPSKREGIAHCGYRLTLRDLPKGNYLITNWVLFSLTGLEDMEILRRSLEQPAYILIDNATDFQSGIRTVHSAMKKK